LFFATDYAQTEQLGRSVGESYQLFACVGNLYYFIR